MFFNLIAIIIYVCFSTQSIWAGEQCAQPQRGYPSLSFGMIEISPTQCKSQLDRGRWLGFTSVTLSPTFYWKTDHTLYAKNAAGELESCLGYAEELGYDIVYKPMLQSAPQPGIRKNSPLFLNASTLADNLLQPGDGTNDLWRAWFDFRPDSRYQQKVIQPFLNWLGSRPLQGTSFKAAIVVATELHRSVVDYSKDWNDLIWNTQKTLANGGYSMQVQVGVDPTVFGKESWLPAEMRRELSPSECDHYQSMLWTADFFSPSVYGDYLALGFAKNPALSAKKLFEKVESSWEDSLHARGCKLQQTLVDRYKNAQYSGRDRLRSNKVSWPGEIGYGGSLSRSYAVFEKDPPPLTDEEKLNSYKSTTLISDQLDLVTYSSIWMKAILDNARGSFQDTINIWITGRYDLFGFSDLPALGDLDSSRGQYTSKDPVQGPDVIPAVAQIRDLIRAYTTDRCPGWKPSLPASSAMPKILSPKPKRPVFHAAPVKSSSCTGNCIDVIATPGPQPEVTDTDPTAVIEE